MKVIAFASVACFALLAGSAAQAASAPGAFEADANATLYQGQTVVGHPYDRCHGRASGTADPACGSLTGGPSGSLF